MGEICPACNKSVDVIREETRGNVTVIAYSCGDQAVHVEARLQNPSLGLKVKNEMGKVTVKSKIEGQIQKTFSMMPDKAIQVVFKEGNIVHLHCKAGGCGNEWKTKESDSWKESFDVQKDPSGTLTIHCKKCGRTYSGG